MSEGIRKQIITTPQGERLVVLPESEFEALIDAVEEKTDQVAVDQWRRERSEGHTDDLPLEVMKKLIDPEHSRIRVWREHRGLTGAQLAKATGLSAAYVSQIETGQRDPGLKALKSIAAALELDLDDVA